MTAMLSNFERMMNLVNEVFDTRSDPSQLQVDEAVISKLQLLHPATLSEFDDGNGPAIWILLIPTSIATMHLFLEGKIDENKLLSDTKPGQKFEAVYLCSATVLPEYRRKGMAMKLCVKAIVEMQESNPIQALYVWPFTNEGLQLSKRIAEQTGLELFIKAEDSDVEL